MNFIENTVIAKILKYFAYFREDIKKIIMNHRAAKALLINKPSEIAIMPGEPASAKLDISNNEDLDELFADLLDKNLVCLVLDCLEEYSQFS